MSVELGAVVRAARDGDSAAWAVLVERFQDFAVATALGWGGDWDRAQDAAQEAFAQAVLRIEELREPDAFAGWFAMLVRTACSRQARRAGPVMVGLEHAEVAGSGSR